LQYGNHKTLQEDTNQMKKAIIKEICRGFALMADSELVYFLSNLHITPMCIVDLDHIYKSPRLIFDSSFRPHHWCYAINDMTNKDTEPKIHFPKTWICFLEWVWNLHTSYPDLEIYLCDDNVSGAFRHVKLKPNGISMHAFMLFGTLCFFTRQTFGDTTSPANWEPVARCR
jgi:hypothetical protein